MSDDEALDTFKHMEALTAAVEAGTIELWDGHESFDAHASRMTQRKLRWRVEILAIYRRRVEQGVARIRMMVPSCGVVPVDQRERLKSERYGTSDSHGRGQ